MLEDSRFRRLGIQSREWEWRVPGRRLVGRAAMGRQCLVLACGGEVRRKEGERHHIMSCCCVSEAWDRLLAISKPAARSGRGR